MIDVHEGWTDRIQALRLEILARALPAMWEPPEEYSVAIEIRRWETPWGTTWPGCGLVVRWEGEERFALFLAAVPADLADRLAAFLCAPARSESLPHDASVKVTSAAVDEEVPEEWRRLPELQEPVFLRVRDGSTGRRVAAANPSSGLAHGDFIVQVVRGDTPPPGVEVIDGPRDAQRHVSWIRAGRVGRATVKVVTGSARLLRASQAGAR